MVPQYNMAQGWNRVSVICTCLILILEVLILETTAWRGQNEGGGGAKEKHQRLCDPSGISDNCEIKFGVWEGKKRF